MGVLRAIRSRPVDVDSDPHDLIGDLLRRAGRGDQKVVRDPSHAEEVAQEVFVELWRLAARFDGTKGSARTWAATLAHRRAIDRVRSEQATRNRQDRDANQVVREHDTVAAEVEASMDQVRVRKAMSRLSDIQREAVELAYFGGHTYREVAVLLDVAEGTVKSRIRDGMIRLRDELGGES